MNNCWYLQFTLGLQRSHKFYSQLQKKCAHLPFATIPAASQYFLCFLARIYKMGTYTMTMRRKKHFNDHSGRERREKPNKRKIRDILRLTGNILGFLSTMPYGFACNESNALLIMVLEFLLKYNRS